MNGYLKDPYSNKDLLFEDARNGFIKMGSSSGNQVIIPEHTPIGDQLSSQSCVANATVDALEILQGLIGEVQQLSRLFVYWNARVYTNDTDKDDGTYIRNAFDSLSTLGVCQESTWEFDVSKVFLQPNLFAYKEANDNKINSFYRINTDGKSRADYVEEAISSKHPVVFGTAVSKSFTSFQGSGIWNPPTVIYGNHAMIVTGVRHTNRGREFLIRNSWGKTWGDQEYPGHAWFSESYITSDLSSDFWVPTLMEQLI